MLLMRAEEASLLLLEPLFTRPIDLILEILALYVPLGASPLLYA